MQFQDIAPLRLASQHILHAHSDSPANIVRYMGAMQAQDYNGALWSIGLRSSHLTRLDIEQSIENREIIRTWPMRGTIHFLAAEDARWITQLTAGKIVRSAAARSRELEIDDSDVHQCRQIVEKALRDGPVLRQDIMDIFEEHGQSTKGQRGYHLLWRLALDGVICFGPHIGKQPTFALLDQWVPTSKSYTHDEALHELTLRYFTSHSPATVKDFAGWASITLTEAKQGILSCNLTSELVEGVELWLSPAKSLTTKPSAFLLPGFDEFMLGYKDRSAALIKEHAHKIVPGNNGMFKPTIVFDGQVIGTWKKTERKSTSLITLEAFESIDDTHRERLGKAMEHYGQFLGQPIAFAV